MYTLSKAYKNDYICVSANTDYGFYAAFEALVICCMNGIRIRIAAYLKGGGGHIPSLTDP